MTRGDKYLAAGILFVALLAISLPLIRSSLFHNEANSARAVITARGKIVREIDLSGNEMGSTFVVRGRLGDATVQVEGERIRMKESPCPEQICVRQGWIDKPGESVICIPGEIIIRIEGAAPVDAVTR